MVTLEGPATRFCMASRARFEKPHADLTYRLAPSATEPGLARASAPDSFSHSPARSPMSRSPPGVTDTE